MCLDFCFCFFIWYSYRKYESRNGIKDCAIIAGIKKYKSVTKKKKKNHDKIIFPAKTNFNSIEVLISKALNDSYISHDDLF